MCKLSFFFHKKKKDVEPVKFPYNGSYVGCYVDNIPRDMKGSMLFLETTNSIENCIQECWNNYMIYAGLQYGLELCLFFFLVIATFLYANLFMMIYSGFQVNNVSAQIQWAYTERQTMLIAIWNALEILTNIVEACGEIAYISLVVCWCLFIFLK